MMTASSILECCTDVRQSCSAGSKRFVYVSRLKPWSSAGRRGGHYSPRGWHPVTAKGKSEWTSEESRSRQRATSESWVKATFKHGLDFFAHLPQRATPTDLSQTGSDSAFSHFVQRRQHGYSEAGSKRDGRCLPVAENCGWGMIWRI